MAAFEYEALDARGREVRGVLEGDAERQIRSLLRDKGLMPMRVQAIRQGEPGMRRSFSLRRGISSADLSLITRQFATLVHAGLTIEESLNALVEQSEKARARSILAGVRGKVLEGQSLARALGAFPDAFPDIYRHMVDAGEQSGRLDIVLERLADYTEEREALQQKVMLAFLYPVILTVLATGIVTFLLIFVVPKVTAVFTTTKQTLPFVTRALIAISNFVQAGGIWWLVAIVGIVFGVRAMLKVPSVRLGWHRNLLRVPVVGRLVRGINAARLASTLGILTSSGIPLLSALNYAVQVVTNLPMKAAVEDALKQVREGGSLSRALGRPKIFPPLVIHLIGSGESSGTLDTMLQRAAEAQTRELEKVVKTFVGVLEPLMIVVMGLIVLFIVLAILMPIFEMNQLLK